MSQPNTPKSAQQSQYQRKLARQRQLELMEAAASGTAPTMELHVSSFAETDGSFLRSRTPDRPTNFQPDDATTSTRTSSSIFDQRRGGSSSGQAVNLMDHDTGIYKESSSSSFADALFRRVRGFFRPEASPFHDASPADMDYLGKPPSSGSRLSPLVVAVKEALADKRKRTLLLVAIGGILVILITALVSIASGSGSRHKLANEKALREANDKRFNEILDHIVMESVSHTDVFLDMASPEHHAIRWVAYSDPAALEPMDPMLLQRYALAVFFYSSYLTFERQAGKQKPIEIGDLQWEGVPNPGWVRKDFWLTKAGHCQWWGVKCEAKEVPVKGSNETTTKEKYDENAPVISLNLTQNHVVGTLPPEFKALEHLTSLDLSHNKLEGTLPWQVTRMFRLEYLWLHKNRFAGKIPKEIGFLEGAKDLRLGHNQLSGSIPSEVNRLFNLKLLALDNNALTGTIPDLHQMQRLSTLHLNHNKFNGYFPFSVARVTSMFELHLNDNVLTGTLPPELETVRHLRVLAAENNKLFGTIPDGMFQGMHHLKELTLQNNKLTGPLPKDMGSERILRVVRLDHNELQGSIPVEWNNMTGVEMLHLQKNKLTGKIPTSVGTMTTLQELWLQDNKLSGVIPSEIGMAQNIKTMYVENNQLTGRVPTEIGFLEKLVTFRMFHNGIKGYMPDDVCDLVSFHSLRNLAADCAASIGYIMKCDCCTKCY